MYETTTLLTVSLRGAVEEHCAQVREAQRRIDVDARLTRLLDEARSRAECLAVGP